jgi:UDP-glucose 4-epimerase
VKLNYSIGPRRPGDVIAIYANNDLAKKALGWNPQFSLEEMMATAWKWEQKLKIDEELLSKQDPDLN